MCIRTGTVISQFDIVNLSDYVLQIKRLLLYSLSTKRSTKAIFFLHTRKKFKKTKDD